MFHWHSALAWWRETYEVAEFVYCRLQSHKEDEQWTPFTPGEYMHFQREINVVNPAPLLIRVSHLEFSFSLQNHYSQKKRKSPPNPKNSNQKCHRWCHLFIQLMKFEQICLWHFLAFYFFNPPKWLETWNKSWFFVVWPAARLVFSANDRVHSNTMVQVCTDANLSHLSCLEYPCLLAAPMLLLPGVREQIGVELVRCFHNFSFSK